MCGGGEFVMFRLVIYMRIYSKTSLNRLTIGPTLSGPFREMVGLES